MIDHHLDFVRIKDLVFAPFDQVVDGHGCRNLMAKDSIEADDVDIAMWVVDRCESKIFSAMVLPISPPCASDSFAFNVIGPAADIFCCSQGIARCLPKT